MIYIYQHLGLGDHIICNGLVRNLIKSDNQYSMFVYSHNYESVKFMYRDLNNLSFIKSTDIEAKNIIKENKSHIVIGHQSYDCKDCT